MLKDVGTSIEEILRGSFDAKEKNQIFIMRKTNSRFRVYNGSDWLFCPMVLEPWFIAELRKLQSTTYFEADIQTMILMLLISPSELFYESGQYTIHHKRSERKQTTFQGCLQVICCAAILEFNSSDYTGEILVHSPVRSGTNLKYLKNMGLYAACWVLLNQIWMCIIPFTGVGRFDYAMWSDYVEWLQIWR